MADPWMQREAQEFAAAFGLSEAGGEALERLLMRSTRRESSDEDALDGATFEAWSRPKPDRAPDAAPSPTVYVHRYEDLGALGEGGMGEVRRVRDRVLNRQLALKILKLPKPSHRTRSRFIEEAQVTAQLSHPGVIAVHELGHLDDARPYFTMKEVQGRTLTQEIRAAHAQAMATPESVGTWTWRRLMGTFVRVCEAVAHAHSRGVVHRDLKPDNVMVGPFGEVLVLDWGLAKLMGQGAVVGELHAADEDAVTSTRREATRTRAGAVMGTPAYMPPEQALGQLDRIGPPSDVYALGAILFEILTGQPPVTGRSAGEILDKVVRGELGELTGPIPIPEPLELICLDCLAHHPDDRWGDAGELVVEIEAWLEGARAREQGLELVAEAARYPAEVTALRARAEALRASAEQHLSALDPWDDEAKKQAGWEAQDEAEVLEAQAELLELEHTRALHAALRHAPDLREAHSALAAHYRAQHAAAEARRDPLAAARCEVLLKAHDHRGVHAEYLAGHGALSLRTEPSGAVARLYRYERHGRRLQPVFQRVLGTTPLVDLELPMGSYRVDLEKEGFRTTCYPVSIGRGERWPGAAPGQTQPTAIRLLRPEQVGEDGVYVPAGWFQAGDTVVTEDTVPRRPMWVDGFIIQRTPVTNRDYVTFLNDLVARGRGQDALGYVPRGQSGVQDGDGAALYGQREDGTFFLTADAEGDVWEPDWPVLNVSWRCAVAYAAWLSERQGVSWHLPSEWAWEKAARGVDGRRYPWGDHSDPSWYCMLDSHPERPLPVGVHAHPIDVSPYGVLGMGGNSSDWCGDLWVPGAALQAVQPAVIPIEGAIDPAMALGSRARRGGSWADVARICGVPIRTSDVPSIRAFNIGFRLARRV